MKKGQRRNEELIREVATRLKEIRIAKELTQDKVYKDTDIHVGRIEAGDSNVTMSTVSDLCKYYKISLEDFFGGVEYDKE